MKIYTIDPHLDENDNHIEITDGVDLTQFTTRDEKTCLGIDLGYFSPNYGATDGSALSPHYLRVGNAKDNHIEALTLTKSDASNKYYANVSDDTSTDKCMVYLKTATAKGVAQMWNRNGLLDDENRIFIEGRCYENNVVIKDKRQYVARPAVVVLNKDEELQFSYYNTVSHGFRLVTFKFDGEQVVIVSNETRAPLKHSNTTVPRVTTETSDKSISTTKPIRGQKNDPWKKGHDTRLQRTHKGTMADGLTALLSAHPEFKLKQDTSRRKPKFHNDHNKRKYFKRKHDAAQA